jgi:hypothetical protein
MGDDAVKCTARGCINKSRTFARVLAATPGLGKDLPSHDTDAKLLLAARMAVLTRELIGLCHSCAVLETTKTMQPNAEGVARG